MKTVLITETLQRYIDVDTNDENDAYMQVKQQYANEEIVLDASDFNCATIEVLEDY